MKQLVVLGAGESGVGAALLGKAKNYKVWVSDNGKIADQFKDVLLKNEIDFEELNHSWEIIEKADIVVKSPGIPDNAKLIVDLNQLGIPVISEIEWASKFTKAKLIGVTGSNGKTTTSSLIYHLLKKVGLNVKLAGNIGESFAKQVIKDEVDYYVLELSSFQLDGIDEAKFDIAVLLNITADHLDRYDYQLDNYIASKFRIAKNSNSKTVFIYANDNKNIRQYLKNKPHDNPSLSFGLKGKSNGYLKGENLVINDGTTWDIPLSILPIKGKHNILNALSALLVAKYLGLKKERIENALLSFKGIEHRLEVVKKVSGVEFINDSKATNVDAVWFALDAMTKPTVWILGGVDKGNDYSVLDELVKEKVKGIIALGKDNDKIIKQFEGLVKEIKSTDNMEDAIKEAFSMASKNNTVLLSPACASFDLFKNYEERGILYKKAINNLITNND